MVGLTSAVSPQQLGVQGFESSFMEGRGQPWIQGQTPSHWLLSFQTDFHSLGDSEWADREQRGQAARGGRVGSRERTRHVHASSRPMRSEAGSLKCRMGRETRPRSRQVGGSMELRAHAG